MMTLEEKLIRNHVSRPIIERILRLNPNPQPGTTLRGWNRKNNPALWRNLVSRGEIIRRHGRHSWHWLISKEKHTPRVIKYGRRKYIAREDYEDSGLLGLGIIDHILAVAISNMQKH